MTMTTTAAIAAIPKIAAGKAYCRLSTGAAYILCSTMKLIAPALVAASLLLSTAVGCGGAGTSSFLPGRSKHLKVDLAPGRYVMACTVPGHRELGMVGFITVK